MYFTRAVVLYSCFVFLIVSGAHFRGGTISWKPISGFDVEFKFKMAWAYGLGPGCTEKKIGQYVNGTFIGDKHWKCVNGCNSSNTAVGPVYYTCTAADQKENWEQGESTFVYTFYGTGPFTISYTGAMWMTLTVPFSQYDGGWNLSTIVDLSRRSDTKEPNNSPITASKPLYTLQFDCQHKIIIPMIDPDGDNVKYRWAVGDECHAICKNVPVATLDEDTCTLSFYADRGNFIDNGWYAAALTIEDFPKTAVTVGNQAYDTTTPLSSIPLQFLIHIVTKPLGCDQRPVFVAPTPLNGSYITVPANNRVNTKLYASNERNTNATVTAISLTSPPGMTFTGPFPDPTRAGVVYWTLNWTPDVSQKGDNILCGMAEDSKGQMSESYCFTYIAWDNDPCTNSGCQHNSTCDRTGSTQNYKCLCLSGYSGSFCENDIDECASKPCQNGGSCIDGIGFFTCSCAANFTGNTCQTDLTVNHDDQSLPRHTTQYCFTSTEVLSVLTVQFLIVVVLIIISAFLLYKIRKMKNTISTKESMNASKPL